MTSTDRVVTLQDPLPDTTWIYELDRDRNTVPSRHGTATIRIELPVEPMLGTVGVAPAGGEVRSSLVPDRFGATWTLPRCAPDRRSSSASTSRARCSPSATVTTARARARPAVRRSRAR
jgi:hypothetical protein